MQIFSFTSSVAALAALATLVSTRPTTKVSPHFDSQVLDGLLAHSNNLNTCQKADIASGALGWLSTIFSQVQKDNEVLGSPLFNL